MNTEKLERVRKTMWAELTTKYPHLTQQFSDYVSIPKNLISAELIFNKEEALEDCGKRFEEFEEVVRESYLRMVNDPSI